MYKKLLVAPLALSLALSTVSPTFASAAEETQTGITENTEAAKEISVTPIISFEGVATASYDKMFTNVKYQEVDNKYNFTMTVSNLLTDVVVNGMTLEVKKDAEDNSYVEFTLEDIEEDADVKISYSAGPMGKMSHEFKFDFTPSYEEAKADYDAKLAALSYTTEEKITSADDLKLANKELGYLDTAVKTLKTLYPELAAVLDATTENNYKAQKEAVAVYTAATVPTAVTPIISFAGVATNSYDKSFTNVNYTVKNGEYKFVMNVSELFTTVVVNGEDLEVKKDAEDNSYVEFTLTDIEKAKDVKIAYEANGYKASHDFKFDFTPTAEEISADYAEKAKNLTYTTDSKITDVTAYKAAAKELSYLTTAYNILKTFKADATINSTHQAQVTAIASYKEKQAKAVSSKLAALNFTKKGSINTKAQLTAAKAQVEAATAAVVAAETAGLTKEEVTAIANYKNIASQQEVIDAGVKQLKTTRTLKATSSNVVGAKDTVKVSGVKKGDTVRLYNAKGKVVKTATATSTSVQFTKVDLGKAAGTLFVTAQATEQTESSKLKISFKAEPVSAKVTAKNVTVKNNKGKSDIITVKSVVKGETITIYDAKGKKITSKKATGKTVIITVKQLGKKEGKIQVARTQAAKHISAKTTVKFSKEK